MTPSYLEYADKASFRLILYKNLLASGFCDLYRCFPEIGQCCRLTDSNRKNRVFWLNSLQKSSTRGFSEYRICKPAAQPYFWKTSIQIAKSARQQSFVYVKSQRCINGIFQVRWGHIQFLSKIQPKNAEFEEIWGVEQKLPFEAPISGI